MGLLVHHQITAGRGHVELSPKSERGFEVKEIRVMVLNGPNRGRHGLRIAIGCAGQWELEERTLYPGMNALTGLKRANGEPLHVPGSTLLWIDAKDHHGESVTDPLLVATFDLETR